MIKTVKKDGKCRRYLKDLKDGDVFTLPKGARITSIVSLKKGSATAYMAIGTVDGKYEVSTFKVTEIPVKDGNITPSLGGTGVTIPVTAPFIPVTITHEAVEAGNLDVSLDGGAAIQVVLEKASILLTITGGADADGNVDITVDGGTPVSIPVLQKSITAEVTAGANADGNVSVTLDGGTPVDIAVLEKSINVNVTAPCTSSGNVDITLDGGAPVSVAVLDTDDTAGKVATKIAGATYTGYVATLTNTTHVVFTKVTGNITSVAVEPNSTGVTATVAAAAGDFTAGAVATKLAAGVYAGFTAVLADATHVKFTKDTGNITSVAISPASTGVTATVASAAGDFTPASIATKVAAGTYTGYTAVVEDTTKVRFTKVVGAIETLAIDGNSTGADGTVGSVDGDITTALVADKLYDLVNLESNYFAVMGFASNMVKIYKGADASHVELIESVEIDNNDTEVTETVGAIGGESTVELVAAAIAAGTYTGYSATANGDTVTFTKTSWGNVTDAAFTDTGATGVEVTVTTTVQGVAGNDVVTKASLSTNGAIIQQTLAIRMDVARVLNPEVLNQLFYVNIDNNAGVPVTTPCVDLMVNYNVFN
jgi:hypothetical protein